MDARIASGLVLVWMLYGWVKVFGYGGEVGGALNFAGKPKIPGKLARAVLRGVFYVFCMGFCV